MQKGMHPRMHRIFCRKYFRYPFFPSNFCPIKIFPVWHSFPGVTVFRETFSATFFPLTFFSVSFSPKNFFQKKEIVTRKLKCWRLVEALNGLLIKKIEPCQLHPLRFYEGFSLSPFESSRIMFGFAHKFVPLYCRANEYWEKGL